ncbi:MAG: hypothetical protein H6865_06650 [Rhodospirillales bacterium]|nr:hypothetical protein [Alphaproteobacteria bacterium]MCB9987300.1 hypothetical protein [Rhodospirillales bacterium]USO07844.1 MAG: hypothetical protein H6866_01050 [Rhodospirillales bacterium]
MSDTSSAFYRPRFPIAPRLQDRLGELFRRKAAQPRVFDLLAQAQKLAGEAYEHQTDKGSDRTLWHHIDAVDAFVVKQYQGQVSPDRLNYLRALAILHEVLEIENSQGLPVWTPRHLLHRGFPAAFVASLDRLARKRWQGYLVYIHELAQDIDAAMLKICDLGVNTDPARAANDSALIKASLQFKKYTLYPCSLEYLREVVAGRIDPKIVSPADFIVNSGALAAKVTDWDAFRREARATPPKPVGWWFCL